MLLGSGSLSGNQVGIRVFLQDQFSQPAGQIQEALKGLTTEYSAFKQNLLADRNASLALSAAGMFAVRGMARAVREGSQFHYVMRGVEAISEGTVEQMTRLNRLAVKIGRETMFTPDQVASGMRFMAMAGQDAEMIFKSIGASTDLAGATMTQLEGKMGAADILTNALKAFGWEAEYSTTMADVLTKATTSANVSLVDLGNSIRYVAATSRNMNIPVQHTIGALMSLGNAGIQASMGGTALENMYRYLAMSFGDFATTQSKRAWADLGMDPKNLRDIHGNMLPITDILEQMRANMEGMDSVKVQNIMRQIFGVRGQRAGATLMRNLEEVKRFQNMLASDSISGTAAEKMGLMMDTLHGSTLKLASAWQGVRASFSKAMEPVIIPFIQALTWISGGIDKILNTGIGKVMAGIGASVVTLATVFVGLRLTIGTLAYALKSFTVTMGVMGSTGNMLKTMFLTAGLGGAPGTKGGGPAPQKPSGKLNIPAGYVGYYKTPEGQTRYKAPRGGKGPMPGLSAPFAPPKNIPSFGYINAGAGSRAAATARGGMMMSKGVKILSGLFTLLGGKFMLVFAGITFLLPWLISVIRNNAQRVSENTEALKAARASSDMREIYLLLKQHNLGDVVTAIQSGIEAVVQSNNRSSRAIQEAIKKGDMAEILRLLHASGRIQMTGAFTEVGR